MTAVIAFTRRGCRLGKELAEALNGILWTPERYAAEFGAQPYDSLRNWAEVRFGQGEAMIFVSAAGIAVRAIAPFVRDKFSDPPVVSVDEAGRFAVPLLSGHVGGANELALRVAELTGGQAAISTATDVNGIFAVDVWAKHNQLYLVEREIAKEISAALLEGRSVGFCSELPWEGGLPAGLQGEDSALGIYVSANPEDSPFPRTLHLIPKDVTLGIGCKRGIEEQRLEETVTRVLREAGIDWRSVGAVATIDLKREEEGLLLLCKNRRWPITFYSARELSQAQGEFTPSEFVSSVTGVDNVCERAAVLSGGELILRKHAENGVTVAAARKPLTLQF